MQQAFPRVDWLLRPPGLIRSAAVYSAFVIGDTLHFVRTGPGWQRLGGSYAAFNFIANPVIERQINRNRQAHEAMAGWDSVREVLARAEWSYRFGNIERLDVYAHEGSGIAMVKLNAREGRPRALTLFSQDYLGGPQVRRDFFSRIPQVRQPDPAWIGLWTTHISPAGKWFSASCQPPPRSLGRKRNSKPQV